MLNKLRLIVLTGSVLFATSSCEELIETEPKQSIELGTSLDTYDGVRAAVIGAYNNLQTLEYYGRDFIVISEVLSDNMRVTVSNSNRFVQHANNTRGNHFAIWRSSYNAYQTINYVNFILAKVDALTDATPAQKNQAKGEALYMRALNYFDLAKVYGYEPRKEVNGFNLSVPIVLEPVVKAEDAAMVSRATNVQVYDQVKKDLLAAIEVLDNTGYPTRITKIAAQAMLSRVYLYLGEWQNAIDMSNTVIAAKGSTFISVPADYAKIFNQPISAESIFELAFATSENRVANSIQSIYMRSDNKANGSGYGDLVPTTTMISAYETGDVRRNLLVAVTKGTESVFWNQKYAGSGGAYGLDNIKIQRITEIYLNRAEAYAELGLFDQARADLNKIRTRAGLAASTAANEQLLNAILNERRVELAYEGHRWFDLKRRGMEIPKTQGLPAIPYNDFKVLAMIPTTETDVNKNIKQNPSY
jgi:starch-binding outer membrane protein, SusD/RagB family